MAKDRLQQLKAQLERLRKDSKKAIGTANELVYARLQKFADKEVKALTEYYDSALASLKKSKESGDFKSAVQTQLDLVQQTVSRLLTHARESLEEAAESRGAQGKKAPAKKAAAPKKAPAARKAPAAKKPAAKKAPRKAAAKKAAAAGEAAPAAEGS